MLKFFLGIIFVIFGSFVTGCATAPPQMPQETIPLPGPEFFHLSDLTDQFSHDLTREIPERKIYLDRTSVRDTITKDVSNFSAYLQDELESSLSKKGFNMVYDLSEAQYLIGATYRKYENSVGVFLKYHRADAMDRKSLNYEIELSRLPGDSFTRDQKSCARKLAADIVAGQKGLSVYITPIRHGKDDFVSEFSKAFTAGIKTEMVRMNREITIIDEVKAYKILENTRNIQKKAKEVINLQSSDAFFANADSVLEGQYYVGSSTVPVTVSLKMLDGRMVSSSSVDIDKSFISLPLENEVQKKLTDLADTKTEAEHNDSVQLSSTKGGDFPVYYAGERIKFHIQVAKPLYVYVYDINSEGEVTLLYESGSSHRRLEPGKLYTIPSKDDDFDLMVTAPFGTDAVKIFASNVELPLPELTENEKSRSFEGMTRSIVRKRKDIQTELSGLKRINPKDLVDYFRGTAEKYDAKLYEDSLKIETKSFIEDRR